MKAQKRFHRMEKSGNDWDKNMDVRKNMPVSSDPKCDPFHDAKNTNGECYGSNGDKLGGLRWQHNENGHHVNSYDAVSNRRATAEYGDGRYHKHETDQSNGNHNNGAYNGHSPNGKNGVAKNKTNRWNQQPTDDYYDEKHQREAKRVVEEHNERFRASEHSTDKGWRDSWGSHHKTKEDRDRWENCPY